MRLLLDSHTLLWALYDPDQLPIHVRDLLASKLNELFVSYATVWEIVNKAAAHRLPMAGSSVQTIVEQMSQFNVTFLPLRLEELTASAMLPWHHDDPFDRILVSQAQLNDLQIVTKDRWIPAYDVRTIWK